MDPQHANDTVAALGVMLRAALEAVGFALVRIGDARSLDVLSGDDAGLQLVNAERADQGGPATCAALDDRPVLIGDLPTAGAWPALTAAATARGWLSAAAWPVHLPDGSGSLAVIFDRPIGDLSEKILLGPDLATMATLVVTGTRELQQAQAMNDHLRGALTTRVLVEQAKGILSVRWGTSPEQAFERLRAHARSNRLRIHDLCRDVIDGAAHID